MFYCLIVSFFFSDQEKVLDLLNRGEKQRSISATGMNETSSRSHSLFVLTVTQRLKGAEGDSIFFFAFDMLNFDFLKFFGRWVNENWKTEFGRFGWI